MCQFVSAAPNTKMHSARMTTTDVLSPQVPEELGTLTMEEHAKERSRLRSGCLKKMSRLILFSPNKPYLDPSCFSVVAVEQLRNIPDDVTSSKRMSFSTRAEVRRLEYTGTGIKHWNSAIFARLEERE